MQTKYLNKSKIAAGYKFIIMNNQSDTSSNPEYLLEDCKS